MIVKMDYSEEGDETGWYVVDPQHERLDSSQLYSHRVIPDELWASYVTARAIAADLEAQISACPLVPRYAAWQAEMKLRQAREDKIRRENEARYQRDLDAQEQLRISGLLRPLPLDCPDDAPVRITPNHEP